jgi:hypothetical protein
MEATSTHSDSSPPLINPLSNETIELSPDNSPSEDEQIDNNNFQKMSEMPR